MSIEKSPDLTIQDTPKTRLWPEIQVIIQPILTFFQRIETSAPVPKKPAASVLGSKDAAEPPPGSQKLAGAALSSAEAADYLNISVRTLRRMCHRKAITFLKITPHQYSFDLHDLEEYKRSRRNKRRNAVQW